MAEEIPDAELVGFSDVGHGVPLGIPAELTEELETFICGWHHTLFGRLDVSAGRGP